MVCTAKRKRARKNEDATPAEEEEQPEAGRDQVQDFNDGFMPDFDSYAQDYNRMSIVLCFYWSDLQICF